MDTISYTFIYEGKEVVLTGRRATRKSARTNHVDTIHEITPKEPGVDPWTKWVHYDELYVIDSPRQ